MEEVSPRIKPMSPSLVHTASNALDDGHSGGVTNRQETRGSYHDSSSVDRSADNHATLQISKVVTVPSTRTSGQFQLRPRLGHEPVARTSAQYLPIHHANTGVSPCAKHEPQNSLQQSLIHSHILTSSQHGSLPQNQNQNPMRKSAPEHLAKQDFMLLNAPTAATKLHYADPGPSAYLGTSSGALVSVAHQSQKALSAPCCCCVAAKGVAATHASPMLPVITVLTPTSLMSMASRQQLYQHEAVLRLQQQHYMSLLMQQQEAYAAVHRETAAAIRPPSSPESGMAVLAAAAASDHGLHRQHSATVTPPQQRRSSSPGCDRLELPPACSPQRAAQQQPSPKAKLVAAPAEFDVICGKGGGTYAHNRHFLDLCTEFAQAYAGTTRRGANGKRGIALNIFHQVRERGGRFLAQNKQQAVGKGEKPAVTWYEMDDARALEKVAHALRDMAAAQNHHEATKYNLCERKSLTSSPKVVSPIGNGKRKRKCQRRTVA